MVANNTAWTPTAPAAPAASAPPPAAPAAKESFTGKPAGIQWEASKEAPKKAAPAPSKEEVTEADAPEGMTAAEKKIWKIKVNGKERDFDATDEAQVRRMIEKAFGADEVFQEAAMTKKQAAQLFGMFKEAAGDPRKLAKLLEHEQFGGANFKKLAEQYLWEQIQEEKLTPEQRKQRQVEEELARYKDQEKQEQSKKEAIEEARVVEEIQSTFTSKIQAMHEEVGLHTNPQSIWRMAEYAREAVDRDEEPDFRKIAHQVKKDYQEEFVTMLGSLSAEQLRAIVPESVLKHLRKLDVDRLKTTTPDQFKASTKRSGPPPKAADQKKLSGSEWREKLLRDRG